LLNFINDDYEKAIASWENVIVQDATLKQELQPWIEKAKAKLQNNKP
jgi:lipopolysaccharide biosynthesis regulator YciM